MYINPLTRNSYVQNGFRRCKNPVLPQKTVSYEECLDMQNALKVPNQDVPFGDRTYVALQSENCIECPDGTVIDLKKHVIYKPKRPDVKILNYPGDSRSNAWNDNEIYNYDSLVTQMTHGNIDIKSQKYWKYADEQSEKLLEELPADVRSMIQQFENAHPSKFEDENA